MGTVTAVGARVGMIALLLVAACDSPAPPPPAWQVVARDLPSAVLSIWGTSATDVFAVGGDAGDGRGPTVMHFDGSSWTRLDTGQIGNLWWVFGFEDGPVYMGGDGGMILRYQSGAFTRMSTPPGTDTVFGLWGAAADDMWAVGGAVGGSSGGFAWRLQGETWVVAPGFPAEVTANSALWKIYGRSADDAWMVGTNGNAVRWDGTSLTVVSTGAGESLFTVHADAQGFVAVGGFGTGSIVENDGSGWRNTSPLGAPGFIGICLTPGGGYAVGQFGTVYSRDGSDWVEEDLELTINESFHSVWVDPSDGVWLAGGQVTTLPLTDGIMLYRGALDVPVF